MKTKISSFYLAFVISLSFVAICQAQFSSQIRKTQYPLDLEVWYPASLRKGERYHVRIFLVNIGDVDISKVTIYVLTYPPICLYKESVGTIPPTYIFILDFYRVADSFSTHKFLKSVQDLVYVKRKTLEDTLEMILYQKRGRRVEKSAYS